MIPTTLKKNCSACACNYLNNRISVEYSVNLTALHKIGRKLHFTILFAHFTTQYIFCTSHIATLCTLNFTLRHTTPTHCITLVLTLYTTHSSPYHEIVHSTLYFTPHYTTLHYTTLHYTSLHYTTLHYTTLHYTTLHYTLGHCHLPWELGRRRIEVCSSCRSLH